MVCALKRTYIFLGPSQMFPLTFWWSLCFYSLNICASTYLYFIYLAWKKKAQILALGKYLLCLLIGKEINSICKGMQLSCQCCLVYIMLSQRGDVPTDVRSMFSQWDISMNNKISSYVSCSEAHWDGDHWTRGRYPVILW